MIEIYIIYLYQLEYLIMCVFIWGRGSKDNLQDLVVSLQLVSPGDQTQAMRLGSKYLQLLKHPASLMEMFIISAKSVK